MQAPVAGFKCDRFVFIQQNGGGRFKVGGVCVCVKRGNVKMEASRGEAQRRTRKTKIYIRDGSDEEQDEEFKSNYLLLLFVFRAFTSCPTAPKMV